MKLQLPRGTRDFAPEDKILRDMVVRVLKNVFELHGYAPLETPTFERFDMLSSKFTGGAEILKETFRFKDQGNRELALRYDLTVPFSRFIAMNPTMKFPFKRYQIGEVYRDGPVAVARFRQFLQCDVDVVGSKKMATDAEIIDLTKTVFEKLNLEVVIKVNNRKVLNDILGFCGVSEDGYETVILTLDKLEKFGDKVVKEELKKKGIELKIVNKILKLINISGTNGSKISKLKKELKGEGITEIEKLFSFLKLMGTKAEFDVSLARGLSYYTGTVFEVVMKKSEIKSSVAGGGRYDEMIGSLIGGGEYPAVGISFGIDRICEVIKESNVDVVKTPVKVFVIPINTLDNSLEIVQKLRKAGIETDVDLLDRSISKNLQYANSLEIPFVLIIGENELKKNKLKLKDMKSGKESMLSLTHVIDSFKL